MNTLTIGVLAVVTLAAGIGCYRGIIKTLASMFLFVIAMGITMLIRPYIYAFVLQHTSIYQWINNNVAVVADNIINGQGTSPLLQISSVLSGQELMDTAKSALVAKITESLLSGGVFVAVFLGVQIILKILVVVLNLIAKLPVLNEMNHILGFLAGALQGIFWVWLFFVVLTLLSSASLKWADQCISMVWASPILRYLYNQNIILKLAMGTQLF